MLILLDIWGIGIGGLWTLLVSTAAVIGVRFLASWTMVINFTASFFLAVWRPFHLGNAVEIIPENLKGRVIDRNLLITVLREQNGGVLVIPNNLFVQKMFSVIDESDRTAFELLESLGNPSPYPTPIAQEIMRSWASAILRISSYAIGLVAIARQNIWRNCGSCCRFRTAEEFGRISCNSFSCRGIIRCVGRDGDSMVGTHRHNDACGGKKSPQSNDVPT